MTIIQIIWTSPLFFAVPKPTPNSVSRVPHNAAGMPGRSIQPNPVGITVHANDVTRRCWPRIRCTSLYNSSSAVTRPATCSHLRCRSLPSARNPPAQLLPPPPLSTLVNSTHTIYRRLRHTWGTFICHSAALRRAPLNPTCMIAPPV